MNAIETLMAFAPFALLAAPMAGFGVGLTLMLLERTRGWSAPQRFADAAAAVSAGTVPPATLAAGWYAESTFVPDAEPANDAAPASRRAA